MQYHDHLVQLENAHREKLSCEKEVIKDEITAKTIPIEQSSIDVQTPYNLIDASSQTVSSSFDKDDDIFERLVKRVLKENEPKKPIWDQNLFLRRGLQNRRRRFASISTAKKRD